MTGFRAILVPLGQLLTVLAGFMVICGMVDYYEHHAEWQSFFISAFITAFFGGGLFLVARSKEVKGFALKQGFVFTTVSWVVLPLFGALPFYLTPAYHMSFTDSYF